MNLYGFCGNNSVNRWDYLGNLGGPVPSGAPQWAKDIITLTLASMAGRSGCNLGIGGDDPRFDMAFYQNAADGAFHLAQLQAQIAANNPPPAFNSKIIPIDMSAKGIENANKPTDSTLSLSLGTDAGNTSFTITSFAPNSVPHDPGTISAGPSNTGLFLLGVADGAKQTGSSLLALANPTNWPTIAYNIATLKFVGDTANASTTNQSMGAYGAGKNVFGLIATEASILLPAALGNRVVVTQTDSVVQVSNVAPIQYTTLPPLGITNDTIVIVDGVPMRFGDAPVGTAFMPGGGVGRVQGGAIGGLMLPSGSTVIQPNGSTAIVPPVQ